MQYPKSTKHPRHAPQSQQPQQRHPSRPVVFRDQSAGLRYLSRSTRTSELSTTWKDGNIYPVIEVDLSSAAHLVRAKETEDHRSELTSASA